MSTDKQKHNLIRAIEMQLREANASVNVERKGDRTLTVYGSRRAAHVSITINGEVRVGAAEHYHGRTIFLDNTPIATSLAILGYVSKGE